MPAMPILSIAYKPLEQILIILSLVQNLALILIPSQTFCDLGICTVNAIHTIAKLQPPWYDERVIFFNGRRSPQARLTPLMYLASAKASPSTGVAGARCLAHCVRAQVT